jgi:hypothetical protein
MERTLLRLCFSEREWEWLQEHQLFRAAAQAIKTYEDVEKVSRFGTRLFRAAHHERRSASSGEAAPPRSAP